jgi:branched-chain amino acid transport system ATP-binding protein
MLSARAITKRFGGLLAVSDASLEVADGKIVALIGPNGAGKTTLFALMAGFLKPNAGRSRSAASASTALRRTNLPARALPYVPDCPPFAGLTVRENIACGAHLHHAKRADALARAAEIAAQVGMERMLDQPAQDLTVAGRKRLELARALATDPKLLLLDEVMAGLIPSEVAEIIPTIRRIRDSGVTILLIEHVMQAVMSLSEEAYVINQGRIIAHGTPAALVRDPQVIEAYLGHGAAQRLHESQAGAGLHA